MTWFIHNPRGYGRGQPPPGLDDNDRVEAITLEEQEILIGRARSFAWGDIGAYSIVMWRRYNDVADT